MSAYSDSATRFATLDPVVRCTGKHRFDSMQRARSVARLSNRRHEEIGRESGRERG